MSILRPGGLSSVTIDLTFSQLDLLLRRNRSVIHKTIKGQHLFLMSILFQNYTHTFDYIKLEVVLFLGFKQSDGQLHGEYERYRNIHSYILLDLVTFL